MGSWVCVHDLGTQQLSCVFSGEWILPFVIMDTLYRILCQTEDLKLMAFRLKALTSPEVAAEETMSKVGTRKERVIIAFDNF